MDYETVIKYFRLVLEEEGSSSCRRVSERMARSGIVNPSTGRPYSRQAIRVLLSKHPEGRQLIDSNIANHYERDPIIVETRQGVIAWMLQHGLAHAKVLKPSEATVDSVAGRNVYGDLPMSLGMMAKSIFVVGIDGKPILDPNISADELNKRNAHFIELHAKRIV
jgi:hypothetical protein